MKPSMIYKLVENLALLVSYSSFCVLENCRHSHRQSPVFPIRSFICGGPPQYQPPAAISSRVTSATLALYLATWRPFWQLFFHNRYILATFLKKTLAFINLEDISSTAPGREREVWLPAQCCFSLRLLWAAEKQHIQLAITQPTRQ